MMNLFCFTLEGSTDSLYEPAHNKQEVAPNCQCSHTLLLHKAKWGGSDPCITSDPTETHTSKLKRWNRRSHVPTSSSDSARLDNINNNVYWMSCSKQDVSRQKSDHYKEMCERSCQSSVRTKDNRMDQLNTEIKQKHLLMKTTGAQVEATESQRTLKKFQRLVQVKRGGQRGAEKGKNVSESNGHLADTVFREDSPVMTCIGLGTWTKTQQQQSMFTDGEEEGVCSPPGVHSHHWSPSECPQPWEPSHHTCHHPWNDNGYGFDFTLPWATDSWDRFESLVHELDTKESEQLPPPIKINPIADLDISESTHSTGFWRSDTSTHHHTLTKPPDNGKSLEKQYGSDDPTRASGIGEKMKTISQTVCKGTGRKHVETLAEGKGKETERDGVDQREVSGGEGPLTKGHRRSSNSLESLCSLNSGQSSSSGVTSGSDSFINRDSQMLEEDPPYPRQFSSRARVHTDFVPSLYDMESLTLKVGDVIDIIAKPPMGIWTGMLNDKIGTFKFIYVDVLVDRAPEPHKKMPTPKRSQRSQPKTLLELLERLSLEEYASALLQNGYHTIDDLMELREQHLMELNMSDPKHRRRLLAAVGSLQQPQSYNQWKSETPQESECPTESFKANRNNYPRDSGCHIPSEYSDDCKEDTEIHFSSFRGPLTETPAT